MIIAKIYKPRAGLAPRSFRKVATLLALGLAISMKRVGRVEHIRTYIWRRHPDVVSFGKCREVAIDLPDRLTDAVEAAGKLVKEVDEYESRLSRGATLTVGWSFGNAELEADIDVYSNEEVPRALGITDRPAAVIAEPRGYAGEESVSSFYYLLEDLEPLMRELYTQLASVDVVVSTYVGPRRRRLAELVAWTRVSRNYALDLRNAVPIIYRPWVEQLTVDLYAIAPRDLRRLAGPLGLRRVVREDKEELLIFLRGRYRVETHPGELLTLYPKPSSPPTKTHEEAVEALARALGEALRKTASKEAVERLLQRAGVLKWEDYVEALAAEFRQQLKAVR